MDIPNIADSTVIKDIIDKQVLTVIAQVITHEETFTVRYALSTCGAIYTLYLK
jgi:hypothetical protein